MIVAALSDTKGPDARDDAASVLDRGRLRPVAGIGDDLDHRPAFGHRSWTEGGRLLRRDRGIELQERDVPPQVLEARLAVIDVVRRDRRPRHAAQRRMRVAAQPGDEAQIGKQHRPAREGMIEAMRGRHRVPVRDERRGAEPPARHV